MGEKAAKIQQGNNNKKKNLSMKKTNKGTRGCGISQTLARGIRRSRTCVDPSAVFKIFFLKKAATVKVKAVRFRDLPLFEESVNTLILYVEEGKNPCSKSCWSSPVRGNTQITVITVTH